MVQRVKMQTQRIVRVETGIAKTKITIKEELDTNLTVQRVDSEAKALARDNSNNKEHRSQKTAEAEVPATERRPQIFLSKMAVLYGKTTPVRPSTTKLRIP